MLSSGTSFAECPDDADCLSPDWNVCLEEDQLEAYEGRLRECHTKNEELVEELKTAKETPRAVEPFEAIAFTAGGVAVGLAAGLILGFRAAQSPQK